MRLAVILLALPLLGAAPPSPSQPNAGPAARAPKGSECRLLTETGDRGTVRLRKLGELPPAEAYAAMYRTDEKGCPTPVLYRSR